jgi:hypothetical protein
MHTVFLSAAVGLLLALGVGVSATVTGMDRDRSLYPVILMAIAALYGLFGTIDGASSVIALEVVGIVPFAALAVVGFRRSLWLVVVGLFCHGVYDFVHARLITDTGVPPWWPVFCLAYDATAALYLAALLVRARVPARLPAHLAR